MVTNEREQDDLLSEFDSMSEWLELSWKKSKIKSTCHYLFSRCSLQEINAK
jgi:hypothetical protein